MWRFRREVLKNEEVCLICNQQRPEVPKKGWCAAKHYAICQAIPNRIFGYKKIGDCELQEVIEIAPNERKCIYIKRFSEK